ncbi:MAG: hypothetical protein HQM15_00825 [Deltaproteobacteria bacterium]|nr:hypothetical protein [Deltaproteobacteria bacterium]
MKKTLTPLLLSTCVLPGLGQFKLGQRLKGLCLSFSSVLLCLIPLLFFMRSFWKLSLIPLHHHDHLFPKMGKNLWQSFIQNERLILISLFLLVGVWVWNVWDVWRGIKEVRSEA